MTREAWLESAVKIFRDWFAQAGSPLPEKIRVTCGWPSRGGLARKQRVIGQCWAPSASADGSTQIFISPYIGEASRALDVLIHELVHAAVGTDAGHGKEFAQLARRIGLDGKPTATVAGEEMKKRLAETVLPVLGDYPHAQMDVSGESSDTPKKQSARMLKCACAACGYTVRTTRKWLEIAVPTCPDEDCARHGEAMDAGSAPTPGAGRPGSVPVPV